MCSFVLVIHISVWSGLAEVEYDEEKDREMAISRGYVARTVGGLPSTPFVHVVAFVS